MIVFNAAIILSQITKVKNNVFPSLGNQILYQTTEYRVGLSDTTVLAIYRDILKVSIS